jgi:putative FmdB family regulatory protein
MPTYEYRCPDGHSFERFAKMSEAASELPCPTCGKLAMRQLSGGAGLVFKGSGFYLTDYGKNAHRKPGPEGAAAPSSNGDSAGGESKAGEKSADVKPAESKSTESKSSESKSSEHKASGKSGEKSTSSTTAAPSSPSKKSDT